MKSIPGAVSVASVAGVYRVDFDGFSRLATQTEIDMAIAALQADELKVTESSTARNDAKRALSELEPLLTHKEPAIALLASVMQKHILATLGR